MVYFYLIVTEMCASSIDTFWLFINYAQTRYIFNKLQADFFFFLIEFVDITIYNDSALTVSFRIWMTVEICSARGQAATFRGIIGQIFNKVWSLLWHTLSHFVSVTNNFSHQGHPRGGIFFLYWGTYVKDKGSLFNSENTFFFVDKK